MYKRKRISARMHSDREAERDQENERKSDSSQSVLPRGEQPRSGETDIFIARARSGAHLFCARPAGRVAGRTFIDVRRLRGVLVTVEFEGPHRRPWDSTWYRARRVGRPSPDGWYGR